MEKQEFIDLLIVDYSYSPGPRYCNQGDDSGEDFYHTKLNSAFYHAMANNKFLRVSLDGTDGYASSFLDEAFGNLVFDFGKDNVCKYLTIISEEEPEWIGMLENDTYNEWENRRRLNNPPTITTGHKAWYRYANGKTENKVWLDF